MTDIGIQHVMGQKELLWVSVVPVLCCESHTHRYSRSKKRVLDIVLNLVLGTPALNPAPGPLHLRKQSTSGCSVGSNLSPVSTGNLVGKHTVSNGITDNKNFVDDLRPHTETSSHEKNSCERSSSSPKTASVETEQEMRMSRLLESDNNAYRLPEGRYQVKVGGFGVHHTFMDGTAEGKQTDLARQLREDGVVDLRNTTDTDGDITWAPGTFFFSVTLRHMRALGYQNSTRTLYTY